MSDLPPLPERDRLPRWVWKGVVLFWAGWLAAGYIKGWVHALSGLFLLLLVSLFLSLAIEPGSGAMPLGPWPVRK